MEGVELATEGGDENQFSPPTVEEVSYNEPIKVQSTKWSCRHKPTGQLWEYMESLNSISCVG